MDLSPALSQLRRNGWAQGIGTLSEFRHALYSVPLEPTPTQSGRDTRVLRPYTTENAPRRSMSAVVGLAEQPLHTDGAHLSTPPDVIVLFSEATNETATSWWEPSGSALLGAATSGIFTVRTHAGSFLASAHAWGQWRFDPECMSPADEQARAVARALGAARAEASKFHWDAENKFLMINNRRLLHARDSITDGDEDRTLERLTLSWTAASNA